MRQELHSVLLRFRCPLLTMVRMQQAESKKFRTKLDEKFWKCSNRSKPKPASSRQNLPVLWTYLQLLQHINFDKTILLLLPLSMVLQTRKPNLGLVSSLIIGTPTPNSASRDSTENKIPSGTQTTSSARTRSSKRTASPTILSRRSQFAKNSSTNRNLTRETWSFTTTFECRRVHSTKQKCCDRQMIPFSRTVNTARCRLLNR